MHCGIDFGTSNTTLSVMHHGAPVLIALENGQPTLPSALFFPADAHAMPLFGRAAVAAYLSGAEGRFMRSLKRVLGTSIMANGTLINGRRFTFNALIGAFLRHIKNVAETQTGQTLTAVTLGRPVHFQDNNPDADARAEQELRAIAREVGFHTVAFQYEPIAGALAHEAALDREQLALVIDIGGGTSDFSVIRLDPHRVPGRDRTQDILANTGIRLGGNDCDKTINLHAAMPLLGLGSTMGSTMGDKTLEVPAGLYFDLSDWSKIMLCYTPQSKNTVRQILREAHEPDKIMRLETVLNDQLAHRILNVSEDAKIALSVQADTTLTYDFLDRGLDTALSQQTMNALFDHLLGPVTAVMHDCLQQAGVRPEQIGALVLTGGSTALPFFQAIWARDFPHAQLLDADRLGSVGLGLSFS